MARIAGINIPPQQHAEIGLTAIYGIGRSRSRLILEQCGIPCTKKVQDLTDAELERIRDAVSKFTVEGDLRREVQLSIKRLIDLGTYRGMRHRRGHFHSGCDPDPAQRRPSFQASPRLIHQNFSFC